MKELCIKTDDRIITVEKLTAFEMIIFNRENCHAVGMTLTNEEAKRLAEFIMEVKINEDLHYLTGYNRAIEDASKICEHSGYAEQIRQLKRNVGKQS